MARATVDFLRKLLNVLVVGVALSSLTGCVANPPPVIGIAIAGDSQATVSWQAPPGDTGVPIAKYQVTPFIGSVAQTPVVFSSTATTQTVTGLTNGTTYTFAVVSIDARGNDSASSARSNPVSYIRPPATSVTAGYQHSCAVLSDGTARCWGANTIGQLGDGSVITLFGESLTPVPVVTLTDATRLSAADGHTCATSASGTVTCWGDNHDGELGHGSGPATSTPVAVTGLTSATAVSTGAQNSCARRASGSVECWGNNSFGQLGNGSSVIQSTVPVVVTGITDATTVEVGDFYACAVLAGGTVKCWGNNGEGELGNGGTPITSSTPVSVTGITDAVAVSAGYRHACALRSTGAVSCWGDNPYGQLGNGTIASSSTPVPVSGLTDAVAISTGVVHSCALRVGGTVMCWGNNGSGQLGNGTFVSSSTPTPVQAITGVTDMAAGGNHSCAVLANGAVTCWGWNTAGQLGNGTKATSSTPVAVSGW